MERLFIAEGNKVIYKEKPCILIRIIDIQTVSVEEIETNIIHTVKINELSPYINENNIVSSDNIHSLSEKNWNKALKRYEIIKPALNKRGNLDVIKDISKNHNVSIPTIYRWIALFDETGLVSSLAGKKRNANLGKSRLTPFQDEIITDKIHSVYLNKSRKSITKTIREIHLACSHAGIKPPHANTIRNRIKNISDEEQVRKRLGLQEAKYKFEPIKGHYTDAKYPLSIVQIDHTPVDIILVDEKYRKPFKRPWLTLAIDVFSRMVLGLYLSFETPGAHGTGICIANSILPKEMWLEEVGVNVDWPCWGIMDTIHVDNAKEFRGNMLKKSCQNYGIDLQFRPIGAPHWGGHIERLLGTFAQEIHNLPGTTFSNVAERKNYESEKNASFTLPEFEKWLVTYITKIYHNRKHSSLSISPLQKYKNGLLGNSKEPGKGIPPRINNERKTRLDFMPYFERTVQEYGVVIDHIYYYDDVLRPYIHNTVDTKTKSRFIFKRDPRDISVIYFYDPNNDEYYDIPYSNTSLPPVSIWEFRELKRRLKQNQVPISEESLFNSYRELNEIEERAIRETKTRKRYQKHDKQIIGKFEEMETKEEKYEEIQPFDDLEDETFDSKY